MSNLTENKKKCKACSITVQTSEDEIDKAIEKLSRLKGIKFVSDEIYESRLEKCMACQYLEYGTTCMQCGCIVQIRAKMPDSSCPYPHNHKW